jgi:catecholate siderophore receptor
MHLRFASFAAFLLTGAAPVWAADEVGTAASDGTDPAREIIVTGQRSEYGVKSTSTATKTNTDIKNIPQAISVVSEAQIADQDLRSVADVLTFVPGAMPGTGEGNRDQIVLRGNNSTADFFVDGIRDDVQYFRDLYNVDRVEVLKGPNAMIFGRGGGGGVVNRVTKKAGLGSFGEAAVLGDSNGGYRLTGDINRSVGSNAGIRINGMFENGESFRKHVDLKRYAINPTVALLAGPSTRIDLSYEHFHDRRTADRGIPADGNRPLKGYDDVFFGDPDLSYARADADIGTVAVQHDFGGGLTLRNRTLYGSYDKFYQNVFPRRLVGTQVELSGYNNATTRKNLFSQTDLAWDNRLGGVEQTLLLGFEVGRQKSRNGRMTATIANPFVPLADPTVDADAIFAPSATDANNNVHANVGAIYVQDQIRLSPVFEVVAGLRFDRFKLNIDDLRPSAGGAEFSRTDELWSPRLGLIFKPQANLSLYASYSRSFLPQTGDQFSGLNASTEALKPERFDNYEVGAKWEPLKGLLATIAIYRLDRTNTRATDPADPSRILLTGAQRSRGIEVGLERSVTHRWQISAGYALQKAEITEETTAAAPGQQVQLVPRHQFSFWNRYDVTNRLGVGLGIVARSKVYASIGNTVRLPGYTRVDAAAFYKLAPKVRAQVNVQNLFNADYFPSSNGDNNIAPGAPRSVSAGLRFGF